MAQSETVFTAAEAIDYIRFVANQAKDATGKADDWKWTEEFIQLRTALTDILTALDYTERGDK
jgi:hypothetical protein